MPDKPNTGGGRIKLRPCPWCGTKPRHRNISGVVDDDDKSVYCGVCWGTGPHAKNATEARKAWNKRI